MQYICLNVKGVACPNLSRLGLGFARCWHNCKERWRCGSQPRQEKDGGKMPSGSQGTWESCSQYIYVCQLMKMHLGFLILHPAFPLSVFSIPIVILLQFSPYNPVMTCQRAGAHQLKGLWCLLPEDEEGEQEEEQLYCKYDILWNFKLRSNAVNVISHIAACSMHVNSQKYLCGHPTYIRKLSCRKY